jgi:hypothetical protein
MKIENPICPPAAAPDENKSTAGSSEPDVELSSPAAVIFPTSVQSLIKNPPLLATEDADAYADNIFRLVRQLKTDDILGRLLVRDVIESYVEVRRVKMAKVGLVEHTRDRAAEVILAKNDDGPQMDAVVEVIKSWPPVAEDDEQAVQELKRSLPPKPKAVPNTETVSALSFLHNISTYERLETLHAKIEGRLKDSLHELQHHLSAAGRRRTRRPEIIDAECTDTLQP